MAWRARDGWRALALRATVLGALTATAVGLAGDGPGRASSEPWRLGRPDTSVVGVVALAAVALGGLLLVLAVVGQREERAVLRRRSPWVGLLLVAAALALALLVDRPDGPPAVDPPPAEPVASLPPDAVPPGADGSTSALGVGLLAVACLTAALLARHRRTSPTAAPGPEEAALDEGLAAAAGALRASTGSAPRDRVIGAYAAFEEALAARGVARSPSATPSALLLASVASGAPAAPATRLTELFTTARYAEARMTAADVAAAERALDELLAPR